MTTGPLTTATEPHRAHTHEAHDHAGHGHSHAVARRTRIPPDFPPSLLRLGVAERLILAGGLVLIIWLMIYGVLS